MKIPVIVLFAPTASGKTALAIKLFGKSSPSFFKDKCELISADSMQVYKKLDIGTAKPSLKERDCLTHHLIDIIDYKNQFTIADFIEKADILCEDIYKRGKIPLICGGTGFYIRNFMLGLPETPESSEEIRNQLKERMKNEGKEVLYEELRTIDPLSAEKININDEYRIIRALEVFYTTGKTRSSFKLNTTLREKYNFITIILERNRDELYERINERVDLMFSQGLQKEVENLIEEGAESDMPGMQAIGYREWFTGDRSSIEGVEEIKYQIKRASRKYAKKQYTFMKDIPFSHIIKWENEEKTIKSIEKLLLSYLT